MVLASILPQNLRLLYVIRAPNVGIIEVLLLAVSRTAEGFFVQQILSDAVKDNTDYTKTVLYGLCIKW